MFLFNQKHKTPVSTYTDSYRPPCSLKKLEKSPPQLCKENKFVTQGLRRFWQQNASNQGQLEKLTKAVMEDYLYQNAIDPTAYWPKKYWLMTREEKYSPVFVNENKYITWRADPYNSAGWNKYSTYLTLLPKEKRMETLLRSIPVPYSPQPPCLSQYERDCGILHRLSWLSPPPLQTVYITSGRKPFQGYFSSCSGRHYCLRGMDYYVDGDPAIRGHCHLSIPCCTYSPLVTCCATTHHPPPLCTRMSPRWDSSHFQKVGGVQRGSFTIHPGFASE
ncbi:SMRP1 protein, partial [Alectura lathami]|nr:SMRP1 protein [Alectura lathami]